MPQGACERARLLLRPHRVRFRTRRATLARTMLACLIAASLACSAPEGAGSGPGFHIEALHRAAPSDGLLVAGRESACEWEAVGARPFREVLASWNLDVPEGAGAVVELQAAAGSERSEWLHLGEWGAPPAQRAPLVSALGKVETDWFKAAQPIDRIRVRVRAHGRAGLEVRVARLDLVLSDRSDTSGLAALDARPPLERASWVRRLDVPFRSQRNAGATIASRVCSPTSTSMVMAYRGVDVELERFCASAFDGPNDIYGNWPRNVQAAWVHGVPGHLMRYSHWRDVEASIAAGQPLVASIRVKPGELKGAPYESTDGHLVVLVGFDEAGNVLANDPATSDPARGRCVWSRKDLETVWMGRGGVAYVLLPPAKAPGGR